LIIAGESPRRSSSGLDGSPPGQTNALGENFRQIRAEVIPVPNLEASSAAEQVECCKQLAGSVR
jgi:hypothetical protein